jgi:hypothetical protein
MTGTHPAVFKKLALLLAATAAIFRGKVVKQFLEIRIFFENRFIQKDLETFGIGRKIPQDFQKLKAVFADITIHVSKTFFAAQTAGGQGFHNFIMCHFFVSFPLIWYGFFRSDLIVEVAF